MFFKMGQNILHPFSKILQRCYKTPTMLKLLTTDGVSKYFVFGTTEYRHLWEDMKVRNISIHSGPSAFSRSFLNSPQYSVTVSALLVWETTPCCHGLTDSRGAQGKVRGNLVLRVVFIMTFLSPSSSLIEFTHSILVISLITIYWWKN